MSWVARRPLKVLVSVGGFRVKISFQISFRKFHHNVKEGKEFLRFYTYQHPNGVKNTNIYKTKRDYVSKGLTFHYLAKKKQETQNGGQPVVGN